MRFTSAVVWVLLPIAAGTGLYLLKMQVEAQEQRLAVLHRDIAEAEESIHVLKAEWSYLNEPVRLREEAEKYLDMRPVRPTQIVTIDSIPFADAVAPAPGPAARDQATAPRASAARPEAVKATRAVAAAAPAPATTPTRSHP